jgi:hypothetical protein
MGELDGLLLDRLDIEVDNYTPAPDLLRAAQRLTKRRSRKRWCRTC